MQIREMLLSMASHAYARTAEAMFDVRTKVIKFFNPNAVVVKGMWDLVLRGPDGTIKDHRKVFVPNVVVTAGKDHLAAFLASASGSGDYTMKYLAIGTGTTAESAAQTALVTEVGTRVTGTKSNPSGAIYRVVGTFAAGNPAGTNAITEAGTFSASSVGTMLNRKLFSAINKTADDSLEITMEVTFS